MKLRLAKPLTIWNWDAESKIPVESVRAHRDINGTLSWNKVDVKKTRRLDSRQACKARSMR